MNYKDYYKIMGVDKKATAKDIKAAYRKLARQHHPDVNPGNKQAEARFKEINEAYEVLGDEEKRKKYDELGAHWKEYEQWQKAGGGAGGQPFDWGRYGFAGAGGPGGGRGGGVHYQTMTEEDLQNLFGGAGGESPFSSFFYTFFGGDQPGAAPGGGRYRTAGRSRRGQDFEQPIDISLEEAYHGTERSLQLSSPGGQPRSVRVRIPAGALSGRRLRVPGKGQASMHGAAGDLYLRIEVEPHALYRLEGKDIYLETPITPWEAASGSRAIRCAA